MYVKKTKRMLNILHFFGFFSNINIDSKKDKRVYYEYKK